MQPFEWHTPPLKHGFGWQDISGVVIGRGNVTSAGIVWYIEAKNIYHRCLTTKKKLLIIRRKIQVQNIKLKLIYSAIQKLSQLVATLCQVWHSILWSNNTCRSS